MTVPVFFYAEKRDQIIDVISGSESLLLLNLRIGTSETAYFCRGLFMWSVSWETAVSREIVRTLFKS